MHAMRETTRLMLPAGLFVAFLGIGMLLSAAVSVGVAKVGLDGWAYPVFALGLLVSFPASSLLVRAAMNQFRRSRPWDAPRGFPKQTEAGPTKSPPRL